MLCNIKSLNLTLKPLRVGFLWTTSILNCNWVVFLCFMRGLKLLILPKAWDLEKISCLTPTIYVIKQVLGSRGLRSTSLIIIYMKKITHLWLAENKCIFHVRQVQITNNVRCQNFFCFHFLWCVFHTTYQQVTWFQEQFDVNKHL